MVLMSDRRGALVKVMGSSLSKVAGIKVRQAFFAPAMGISPCQSSAASYQNRIHLAVLFVGSIVAGARPRLRFTAAHIRLQSRLQACFTLRLGRLGGRFVFVCHFEGLTQALRVVQTPARFASGFGRYSADFA